jgi:hypothetical protein
MRLLPTTPARQQGFPSQRPRKRRNRSARPGPLVRTRPPGPPAPARSRLPLTLNSRRAFRDAWGGTRQGTISAGDHAARPYPAPWPPAPVGLPPWAPAAWGREHKGAQRLPASRRRAGHPVGRAGPSRRFPALTHDRGRPPVGRRSSRRRPTPGQCEEGLPHDSGHRGSFRGESKRPSRAQAVAETRPRGPAGRVGAGLGSPGLPRDEARLSR